MTSNSASDILSFPPHQERSKLPKNEPIPHPAGDVENRHHLLGQMHGKTDRLIAVFNVLQRLIDLRGKSEYCAKPKQTDDNQLDNQLELLLNSVQPEALYATKETLRELSATQLNDPHADGWETFRDAESQLNLIHTKINSLFQHSIIPILIREQLVEILVSKTKYADLNEEVVVNREIITDLFQSISCMVDVPHTSSESDDERLNAGLGIALSKLDVLDSRMTAIIGAMTMIERRRLRIEELANMDQARRHRTTKFVTAYILVGLVALILTPILWLEPSTIESMKFLNIIPISVMIWSFIGSFAATVLRFNRRPVYQFNDPWKWMLTRHAQGIILSSAFYLVLISGLFLISDGTDGDPSRIKTEVILILSFLIGFSDRFVDHVFNTLLKRYTGDLGNDDPNPRQTATPSTSSAPRLQNVYPEQHVKRHHDNP
jgi:hypothetical protein